MINNELLESMLDMTDRKETFQKLIRDMFNSDKPTSEILEEIASTVGEFKRASKFPDKVTNNIINDVSRICRETAGYSIVCTSRKGGHVYSAVKKEKKERTVKKKEWTVTTDAPAVVIDESVIVSRFITDNPEAAIELLILYHGTDCIGKLFLDVAKKHEAVERDD